MDQHSDLAVVSGQLPIAHQDQNTKTDGNVPRHRLRPAVLRLSWFGGKVGGQWTLPTTLSTSPTTAPYSLTPRIFLAFGLDCLMVR